MIRLKVTYHDSEITETIIPTIFPDGTSQVNKVKVISNIAKYRNAVKAEIIWQFENEAEFLHVSQLSDLLDAWNAYPRPLKILNIPFLPYGRQDKPISNKLTFAQRTFTHLVDSLNFDRVVSFDVHGVCAIKNLHKLSANTTIKKVLQDNKYDVYCYLDGTACTKYHDPDFPEINGVKIKDKQTGKILQYLLSEEDENFKLEGKRILVVNDICDQGGTFIELAKMLNEKKVGDIGMYVSHGIFSNGFDKLTEAGYKEFYYTNSLVKNEEKGIKIV